LARNAGEQEGEAARSFAGLTVVSRDSYWPGEPSEEAPRRLPFSFPNLLLSFERGLVLTFRKQESAFVSDGSVTVPSFNPLLWRRPPVVLQYGIAVLSFAAALLLTYFPAFHLESAPVSIFLCAVMFSAWFGGVGPGLLSTALCAIAFYYSFLPPHGSFSSKADQMARFAVFVLSAVFVGSLSVAQRWATQSLRKARDELAATVQELKHTNEALVKSEAYLAEAQTLSHTGSFGWNVSTGELFWSEESFRIFGYDRPLKPTVQLALERVHPDDLQTVRETLENAAHGKDLDFEHRSWT
jgi:PAS domain-containing protein